MPKGGFTIPSSDNFRMTNLQAVGLAQVEQIEIYRNQGVFGEYYRERFMDVRIEVHAGKGICKIVYWMYGAELDPESDITAEEMMTRLKKHGIATGLSGLHDQPVLKKWGCSSGCGGEISKTDLAYQYGFYLPSD
jgi:dTDP-4-amino-4,6-dideoxygalactose transaminase